MQMKNDLMLYRFLSGSALKVIAVVSMTIDHIAYYILDQQLAGRLQLSDDFGIRLLDV